MSSLYSKETCDDTGLKGFESIISFSIGLVEIIIMILIMLALRFKSTASSWYYGETGVKEGVTLILPIYYPVCFYTIIIGLFSGIVCLIGFSPFITPTVTCIKWIIVRFCCEGLAVFFLHNGVGQKAIKSAIFGGIIWSLLTGLLPLLLYYTTPPSINFYLYVGSFTIFLSFLLLFYLVAWLFPQRRLHRRPALIRFAISNTIITSIFLIDVILILSKFNTSSCLVIILTDLTYFIQPFVVLYALRQDTLFWQGLYRTQESNLNQPLLGIWEMGRETIGCVADTINQLERRVVPIIAFGQLQVDTSKFFSGGTARVYRGRYKQHDVAIKFLFNIELTPTHVVSFCDEATILNSLQHINIVKCFGVAVMPPALCLVTEFCEYGSLYDFLHSLEYFVRQSQTASGSYRPHVVEVDVKDNREKWNGFQSPLQKYKSEHRSTENGDEMIDRTSYDVYGNTVQDKIVDGSDKQNVMFRKSVLSSSTSSRGQGLMKSDSSGNDPSGNDRNSLGTSLFNVSKGRKSMASQLADIVESSTVNNILQQTSIDIHEDSDDSENSERENTESSFISGSTLEKLGFSIHLSVDSRGSDTRSGTPSPGRTFVSKIGTVLSSSAGRFHQSLAAGSNIMKSAVSVMRSYDMGYGLGPSGSMNSKLRHSHRLSVGQSLPLLVKLCLARDAAAGVAFLHSKGMMHCDIKSLNFLVTKDLVVKLADLGEARPIDLKDGEPRQFPRNINWSSPEVLNGSETIDHSADVWSLAFVMTEIFTGTIPFDTAECRMMSFEAFKSEIERGLRPTIPDELLSKNPWFKEMVSSAWAYDPKARLTATEIVGILEMHIQSIIRRQKLGKYHDLS